MRGKSSVGTTGFRVDFASPHWRQVGAALFAGFPIPVAAYLALTTIDGDEGAIELPSHLRVLIVEDHRLFAELLASVLESGDPPAQVSIADTVGAALEQLDVFRPDVIVMDYVLPDGNGVEATKQVMQRQPEARVLMLTASSDPKLILEAIRIGCMGFLTKDEAVHRVVTAVKSVAGAEPVFSASLLNRVALGFKAEASKPQLTEREVEILQGLGFGHSVRELADQFSLSPHTIRNYIQSILAKLEVRSQLQAVVKGISLDIIRPPVSH